MASTSNPQTYVDSGSSITTANYTPPAGSNKIVVWGVYSEYGGGAPAANITSATFGGTAGTLIGSADGEDFEGGRLTVYYNIIGSSTTAGAFAVSLDESDDIIHVGAITLIDVEQQAPEANESATTGATDSDTISDSITTVTANALILSFLGSGTDDDHTLTGTGHTEEIEYLETTDEASGFVIGRVDATTATSYTMGFTRSSSAHGLHQVLAAFEPIASGDTEVTAATETLTLSITDASVTYTPDPLSRDQEAFRFYDDGTEAGATALAAQNVNISIAKTTTFQISVGMQTTGNAPSEDATLQYRLAGSSQAWRDVD